MASSDSVCPDVGTVRPSQRLCQNPKCGELELDWVLLWQGIESHEEVPRQEQRPLSHVPQCGNFQGHLPLLAGWLLDLAATFELKTLHVPHTQAPLHGIPFSTHRHSADLWITFNLPW